MTDGDGYCAVCGKFIAIVADRQEINEETNCGRALCRWAAKDFDVREAVL